MLLWPALLLGFAMLTRLAPIAGLESWPQHFTALTALALCGAALFPQRLALWLPLLSLLLTDLALNAHYHWPLTDPQMLPRYAVFAVAAWIGTKLAAAKLPLLPLLGACLATSTLFYLVTNTASWALEPQYPAGFAGWWQALTTGLPGFPPTLLFFRNSLLGDLTFTGLFWVCYRLGAPAPERAAITAKLSPVR